MVWNRMTLEPIDGIEAKTLTSYTNNEHNAPSEAYINVAKKLNGMWINRTRSLDLY